MPSTNGPKSFILAAALTLAGAGTSAAAEKLTGQALAERYAECWKLFNTKNWDEFGKCYTKDAVSVTPGLPAAKGAAEILAKHSQPLATAFPDIAGELQLTLASGRNAVTIALLRGTHTGPLAGPAGAIPATNKKIGLLGAHAIESGSAHVAAKEWFVQDSGTMMAQLGLSKQPARAALQKGWAERPVVIATGSAQEKANLAAARKAYALFNKHDKGLFDAFAEDARKSDAATPSDLAGRAAIAATIESFWQMASRGKLETTVMFAAGDYVAVIGKFAGTHDGDLPVKRTGKKFTLDLIEITRWKDGKVVELWPFYDGMQLAMQLGLMPPPAGAQAQR
jgi:predicted ester cyclase